MGEAFVFEVLDVVALPASRPLHQYGSGHRIKNFAMTLPVGHAALITAALQEQGDLPDWVPDPVPSGVIRLPKPYAVFEAVVAEVSLAFFSGGSWPRSETSLALSRDFRA